VFWSSGAGLQVFGRAVGESPAGTPGGRQPDAASVPGTPLNPLAGPGADSEGAVSGASPRSETRSFSERAGSDAEGASPPAPHADELSTSLTAGEAADRVVVSDTGELAVRRSSVRRPLSRAASLLERGETTEVSLLSGQSVCAACGSWSAEHGATVMCTFTSEHQQ
jgi:hypothetical protein